uniref:Uncharacterized protein n=1 Tax=Haemonchus contortus TaxID=6289 RepID=A0A7I4YVF0_HAECO
MDDKTTDEVTAFVPSLIALTPLQFSFASFTVGAGQYQRQNLANAIWRHDIVISENNTDRVPVCTRPRREPAGADPILDVLASDPSLTPPSQSSRPSLANTMLDTVYVS